MPADDLSVKKIRKFRLNPRPSAVLRNLKVLHTGTHDTPELEQAVQAHVHETQPLLNTVALYVTLTKSQTPSWSVPLWNASQEGVPVALTFFLVSVGRDYESVLADALARGKIFRGEVLTALGEEWTDQAGRFIERLTADEARQDSCELLSRVDFSNTDPLRETLDLLNANRVGVLLNPTGALSPRFTRVGLIPWSSSKKKK